VVGQLGLSGLLWKPSGCFVDERTETADYGNGAINELYLMARACAWTWDSSARQTRLMNHPQHVRPSGKPMRRKERENQLMAGVPDYTGSGRLLLGTGGQARFGGILVRCGVCRCSITEGPVNAFCHGGHQSPPVHERCIE